MLMIYGLNVFLNLVCKNFVDNFYIYTNQKNQCLRFLFCFFSLSPSLSLNICMCMCVHIYMCDVGFLSVYAHACVCVFQAFLCVVTLITDLIFLLILGLMIFIKIAHANQVTFMEGTHIWYLHSHFRHLNIIQFSYTMINKIHCFT